MNHLLVTHVQMPDGPFSFGLFKAKGLKRTIFQFQFLDGQTVRVENSGKVFLLDSETCNTGKEIELLISGEKIKQYEKEIACLIKKGKTANIIQ